MLFIKTTLLIIEIDCKTKEKTFFEAICKSRNGESGNGLRGMMGTQAIKVGTRGIRVGIRGMGMGMRGMRGIRVGMRGIGVGM